MIPLSDRTAGHGTHTLAAVWKSYLEDLLRTSGPSAATNPAPAGPNHGRPLSARSRLVAARRRVEGGSPGPYTLPSQAYPGTQHTYWVYVPAQYDPAVPTSLMVLNDGQAFKNMEGDIRAPNVLDNLIDRREIPVMLAVFINPGRRPDQPEPTPQEWGDRTTNRPTEYNTLDDKYARVIVDELMPALDEGLQHLEGSGAPWHRRREQRSDRGLHRRLGTSRRVPQGPEHRRQLREPARRSCVQRHRSQEREEAAPGVPAGRPERQPGRRPRRRRTTRPVTGSFRTSG